MATPTVLRNDSNMVSVRIAKGTELMYSYKTLVAVRLNDGRAFRTDVNYSRTTEKHLTQFGMKDATKVSQSVLEGMVK
jgi:hypothetical protein